MQNGKQKDVRGGRTMDTRIKEFELASNCCGASDIYNGNLDNNEGVCADCGEHCEMEER